MKFFCLVACVISMGLCHAGVSKTAGANIREGGCVEHGNKALLRPSIGGAVLQPTQPILLQEGAVLDTMTSRMTGVTFSAGEFTIGTAGSYWIRFFAKAHATQAVPESTITIGLFVNGVQTKTKDLTYLSDIANAQYPAKFAGWERVKLNLNAGDKVCLKIVKVSLPEGASAYFIAEGKTGKTPVAGIFLNTSILPQPKKA